MTEYFAVIIDSTRSGPFYTIGEACRLLKQSSRDRGHTDEEAQHFFLFESAVEQVETVDGSVERFRVGWIKREESGELANASFPKTPDEPVADHAVFSNGPITESSSLRISLLPRL